MLCPTCGKESNNLRVCAHCQTPYPVERSERGGTPRFTREVASQRATRATGAVRAVGDPRIAMARRARLRRAAIGLLAAFTAGFYFFTRERVIPVGVAIPNVIELPMSPGEAAGFLRNVSEDGQVEMRDGVLVVRVPARTFPVKRIGQIAFAQQYARADEMIQRTKRAITFLDPSGSPFAKADPATGVVMTR